MGEEEGRNGSAAAVKVAGAMGAKQVAGLPAPEESKPEAAGAVAEVKLGGGEAAAQVRARQAEEAGEQEAATAATVGGAAALSRAAPESAQSRVGLEAEVALLRRQLKEAAKAWLEAKAASEKQERRHKEELATSKRLLDRERQRASKEQQRADKACSALKKELDKGETLLQVERDRAAVELKRERAAAAERHGSLQHKQGLARRDWELQLRQAKAGGDRLVAQAEEKASQAMDMQLALETHVRELEQALQDASTKSKSQARVEVPLARHLASLKVADLRPEELALAQLFAKDCAREQIRREERERVRVEMRTEMEEEMKQREKEAKECSICLEREANVVFGCGHQACETCGGKLEVCHICRKKVQSKIKLFAPT